MSIVPIPSVFITQLRCHEESMCRGIQLSLVSYLYLYSRKCEMTKIAEVHKLSCVLFAFTGCI